LELIKINDYKYQYIYEDKPNNFDFLFRDEEIFNSFFKEDIFPFIFSNKNLKIIYLSEKINNFIKQYRNNKV